jgi:hypothetical protein
VNTASGVIPASSSPHYNSLPAAVMPLQVVARGLRVKCGVEMGKVSAEMHAVTARVTYSGRTVGVGLLWVNG